MSWDGAKFQQIHQVWATQAVVEQVFLGLSSQGTYGKTDAEQQVTLKHVTDIKVVSTQAPYWWSLC